MKSIPEATAILLRADERVKLEVLAHALKAEHRKRRADYFDGQRWRGDASDRSYLGCTIGTASKWRARFAAKRMAGLDDTGERGAEPKYRPEDNARILALLDQKPPAGYANWTGPLLSKAFGDIHVQYIWRFLRAQKIDLSGRSLDLGARMRARLPEVSERTGDDGPIARLHAARNDDIVCRSRSY
jgi:transposase